MLPCDNHLGGQTWSVPFSVKSLTFEFTTHLSNNLLGRAVFDCHQARRRLHSLERIEDHVFTDGYRHDRQVIEGYELVNCTFDGWAGIRPDWSNPDPSLRSTIRNVTLRNTKAYSDFLQGAIIEDVTVDTTKGGKGPCFLRGNVYRHVVLTGRIAWTEIRGKVFPPLLNMSDEDRDQIMAKWDQANADYYKTVDWALDITQASYASLSIRGVPARLVRRNLENTAIITRESALTQKWRQVAWKHGVFQISIMNLIEDGYDDTLLVACPRSKHYKETLEDLQALRDLGVAE